MKIILIALISLFTLDGVAQNLTKQDSVVSEGRKSRRYDGTKSFDTIVVNGKTYVTSKIELRKKFGEYTKDANETIILNGETLSIKKARQVVIKSNRDSIRAHKNLWGSILGGPAYTPESSFGIGGAALLTFKFNKNDTVLFRSILPFGFLVSVNKTFMLSGGSEFYLKQNKLQINTDYGIRYEPDNYFGVGFKEIDNVKKSDSTTQYTRMQIRLKPITSFRVTDHLLIGVIIDYTYYELLDANKVMAENSYYKSFSNKYLVAGLGLNIRYDSRDNPTMPYSGIRANLSSISYNKFMGSRYAFTYTSADYRQYQQLFNRRSVLAWTGRIDISSGKVPLTELPSFGSPTDLRGYAKGHYRDKTMGYGIVEYRHMFGSKEVYDKRRPFYSRLGAVVWSGVGTIGNNIKNWDRAMWNYGVGLRYEVQPHNNFRIDIGKSPKGGWMFYMNMIEAF